MAGLGTDILTYLAPLAVAVALFVLLWPLSVRRQDASLVDALWGPGFFIQLLVVQLAVGETSSRGLLLTGVVGLWSARLGLVLTRRRLREGHEDPRYRIIRQSWGPTFWWKSLFIVFCLQAVIQWVIALGPISGVMAPPSAIGPLAWIGLAIAIGGFTLEALADRELDLFKRRAPAGALMTDGLRAHIRHPNYLGEIVFWTGIGLIVVDGGTWLGLISPIVVILFLTKVSGVPMLDEHLSRSRPAYAAYKNAVPALLPAFGRSKAKGQDTTDQ